MSPKAAPKEPLSTPHTVTVLLLLSAGVFYAAFYTKAATPDAGSLGGTVKATTEISFALREVVMRWSEPFTHFLLGIGRSKGAPIDNLETRD
jgi:hypothetical protein